MKPGETPEPNRPIKLKCCDWSDYTCEGMWIPFKKGSPKKLSGKSRFCRKDENGNWESDRKSWQDCEEWAYADEL